MEVQKDFKELLELLNKHNVEYVLVGAYALAFHGFPRYTGDLDVLIKNDKKNSEKIVEALKEFGFKHLKTEDFSMPEQVVQLGVQPVRVDILTTLTGVKWTQIKKNCVKGKFGTINVYYIGKKEFIKNKKILGRHKDLADVESINTSKKSKNFI